MAEAVRRILGWFVCMAAACVYTLALVVAGLRRRSLRDKKAQTSLTLLITGRFDSRNWCKAHLVPLLTCRCVRRVIAVVDGPLLTHPKMEVQRTPRWLRLLCGRAIGRSIWAARIAVRDRPDVVMGYHFFPAALTALFLAKAIGARAIYQMTGGPVEVLGAGLATESSLIPRGNTLTRLLKPLVLRICGYFDTIVVRGLNAREFLVERTAARSVAVIPGSIDMREVYRSNSNRRYDVTFVGRLVPVKQPERILAVAEELARLRPGFRMAIVGDGPLREALILETAKRGLDRNIEFLGHREDVARILRCLLYTSPSPRDLSTSRMPSSA